MENEDLESHNIQKVISKIAKIIGNTECSKVSEINQSTYELEVLRLKYEKLLQIQKAEQLHIDNLTNQNRRLTMTLSQQLRRQQETILRSKDNLVNLSQKGRQLLESRGQLSSNLNRFSQHNQNLQLLQLQLVNDISNLDEQMKSNEAQLESLEGNTEDLKIQIEQARTSNAAENEEIEELKRQFTERERELNLTNQETLTQVKRWEEVKTHQSQLIAQIEKLRLIEQRILPQLKAERKQCSSFSARLEELLQTEETITQELALKNDQLNKIRVANKVLDQKIAQIQAIALQTPLENAQNANLNTVVGELARSLTQSSPKSSKGFEGRQSNLSYSPQSNSFVDQNEETEKLAYLKQVSLRAEQAIKNNENIIQQQDQHIKKQLKLIEELKQQIILTANSTDQNNIGGNTNSLQNRTYFQNSSLLNPAETVNNQAGNQTQAQEVGKRVFDQVMNSFQNSHY